MTAQSYADDRCSICLCTLPDVGSSMLSCGHGFHAQCIQRWTAVTPRCPTCRAPTGRPRVAGGSARLSLLLQAASALPLPSDSDSDYDGREGNHDRTGWVSGASSNSTVADVEEDVDQDGARNNTVLSWIVSAVAWMALLLLCEWVASIMHWRT
jgi:hypothetical protein